MTGRADLLVAIGSTASVRVPATSANLGPGYDALGLSLAWHDDVAVEVTAGGLSFDVTGEGAQSTPRDDSHLIVRALRQTLAELGAEAHGLHLRSTNRIPHGRGLGSSAAAICAGVLLARALVPGGDQRLDGAAVLALANRIEGHPDNVAACLLGGLTVAWIDARRDADQGAAPARAVSLSVVATLRPIVLVPPFEASTEQARRLLPATVSHTDAAFNAARSALLVGAITARPDLLLAATEDRLHQPYRASAMPQSAALVAALRAAGLAAVVSGAGPSVLVLTASAPATEAALALAPPGWVASVVDVDRSGATVDGAQDH